MPGPYNNAPPPQQPPPSMSQPRRPNQPEFYQAYYHQPPFPPQHGPAPNAPYHQQPQQWYPAQQFQVQQGGYPRPYPAHSQLPNSQSPYPNHTPVAHQSAQSHQPQNHQGPHHALPNHQVPNHHLPQNQVPPAHQPHLAHSSHQGHISQQGPPVSQAYPAHQAHQSLSPILVSSQQPPQRQYQYQNHQNQPHQQQTHHLQHQPQQYQPHQQYQQHQHQLSQVHHPQSQQHQSQHAAQQHQPQNLHHHQQQQQQHQLQNYFHPQHSQPHHQQPHQSQHPPYQQFQPQHQYRQHQYQERQQPSQRRPSASVLPTPSHALPDRPVAMRDVAQQPTIPVLDKVNATAEAPGLLMAPIAEPPVDSAAPVDSASPVEPGTLDVAPVDPVVVADSATIDSPAPDAAPAVAAAEAVELLIDEEGGMRTPFYAPLPWLSVPEEPFPERTARRRKQRQTSSSLLIQLPARPSHQGPGQHMREFGTSEQITSPTSTNAPPSEIGTTSMPRSDAGSTRAASSLKDASAASSHPVVRPAVPAVTPSKQPPATTKVDSPLPAISVPDKEEAVQDADSRAAEPLDVSPKPAAVPAAKPVPKSWADLVRSNTPQGSSAASSNSLAMPAANATSAASKSHAIADVIRDFNVNHGGKLAFLEPRGLVNTGNMCYMNSVLQVLIHCPPFYDLLDQVGRRASHSFKGETPVLDAMVLFMREFKVIDSAESAEKLRLRLKESELDQFGDSFIPEYVYDAIRRHPQFSNMRRGHQQDAEEFLGLLLEALHNECVTVLRATTSPSDSHETLSLVSEQSSSTETGWLEVGPKQKSSITRSSGNAAESPLSKIFGGELRSELRVPGMKKSVTQEAFRPLQLDIGSAGVDDIVDALKKLTMSETLHGDFGSPRGSTNAVKQVLIETLPPVLILHLKRFQYEDENGTQKIWKKVGYPLDLTMPKELFAPHIRNAALTTGMPKYRLNSVVYHHGKNASGGHYTADVRRQDGKEWIRIDDTVIRRLRSDDVAEGGAGGDEDDEVTPLRKKANKRSSTSISGKNQFESIDQDDSAQDADDEGGWSQVNGSGGKDGSSLKRKANGASSPKTGGSGQSKAGRGDCGRENKVAYILFYRRIV